MNLILKLIESNFKSKRVFFCKLRRFINQIGDKIISLKKGKYLQINTQVKANISLSHC